MSLHLLSTTSMQTVMKLRTIVKPQQCFPNMRQSIEMSFDDGFYYE